MENKPQTTPVKQREDHGLAIVGPYGNIWVDRLFDSPEKAIEYLDAFWKKGNWKPKDWSVVPATQIICAAEVIMQADRVPLEKTNEA